MTAQMDLLDLLAHDPRREDEYRQFLDACRQVRLGQREYVSINDVRSRLSNEWGLVIEPRRYSSFFSRAMREGSLLRTNVLDVNSDERSMGRGRVLTLNRWFLVGMGCCTLACVPYACIRFVEWQIGVASRGPWD